MSDGMGDAFGAQLRAAKAEGELAATKDALQKFAEENGFNPELEPRELLAKATGAFRSCSAMSDARYTEIQKLREDVEAMRPRLMPEGMEWPRYEDGEPVRFGDVVGDVKVRSVVLREYVAILSNCTSVPGWGTWRSYKEPIKRPAPEALDADGVEIRVGDTVYYVDRREQRVNTVARLTDDGCVQFGTINEAGYVTYCEAACIQPNLLTHRAPVISADGRPLRVGDTVYKVGGDGTAYVFDGMSDNVDGLAMLYHYGKPYIGTGLRVDQLTHERPDSWERLKEDANKNYIEYWECDGIPCYDCPAIVDGKQPDKRYNSANCSEAVKCDLVRRANALAGVSE